MKTRFKHWPWGSFIPTFLSVLALTYAMMWLSNEKLNDRTYELCVETILTGCLRSR